MIDLSVQVDQRKLAEINRIFAGWPKAVGSIFSRAINRTLTTTRAEAVKQISAQTPLKKSKIRRQIKLKRATRTNWIGTVALSGQGIPLIQYGATNTGPGISYQVTNQGGRDTAENAFIAKMPTGHVGVYERAGAARLPIFELKGPSLGDAVEGTPALLSAIHKKASESLEKYIDDQVKLFLMRKR